MRKMIAAVTAVMMLMCVPVSAANHNVYDASVYYGEANFYHVSNGSCLPISKIVSGNVLCQYSVIYDESSEMSMLACLYLDKALVLAKSMTQSVQAGAGTVFSANVEVPAMGGYEIRLFLVNGLNTGVPVKDVALLSEKSNAKEVLSFSYAGSDGVIDHLANTISVKIPYKQGVEGTMPELTVSEGASYKLSSEDFTKPVTVTVTAEDGTERSYVVTVYEAKQDYLLDFDNAYGDLSDQNIWKTEYVEEAGTNVTVEEEDGNKILRLDDQAAGQDMSCRAWISSDAFRLAPPFEISTKVRYQLPEGIDRADSVNNFSYFLFIVDPGTNICGFEPVQQSGNFVMTYYKNGSRVYSNFKVQPDAWYQVTMKYYQESDGKYYTDYTFAAADGSETKKYQGIESKELTQETMSTIRMYTSPARCGVMSLDDISLCEIDDYDRIYAQDFSEPGDFPAGNVENGRLRLDANDAVTVNTGRFLGSVKYSFDAAFDNLSDTKSLFAFGNEDGNAVELIYDSGALWYTYGGSERKLGEIPLTSGQNDRIEVNYIEDAVYENNRIDILVDGISVGSIKPMGVFHELTNVTFRGLSGGSVWIDNLRVERR